MNRWRVIDEVACHGFISTHRHPPIYFLLPLMEPCRSMARFKEMASHVHHC